MRLWRPVAESVWQGRDDSAEASNATRIFQTIQQQATFTPLPEGIALIGFECDEGVKRNQGRPGAGQAPDILRKALANMASHQGHERLADMGSVCVEGDELEAAQQALSDAVTACQQSGMRTLVFGGGHETAWRMAGAFWMLSQTSAWRLSTLTPTLTCARPTVRRPARRFASWRAIAMNAGGNFATPV